MPRVRSEGRRQSRRRAVDDCRRAELIRLIPLIAGRGYKMPVDLVAAACAVEVYLVLPGGCVADVLCAAVVHMVPRPGIAAGVHDCCTLETCCADA